MRKAIFSKEDIIKAGQALEKQEGRSVSGWEVFKAMGEKGKLSRFSEVWESHSANKTVQTIQEVTLPVDVEESLEAALLALRGEFTGVLSGIIRELQEEHLRQSELARRDHLNQEAILLNKVETMSGELGFLRKRVAELEQEDEVTIEVPADAPAEPSASRKAPATASKAVPKILNRPLKNIPAKKVSRQAPPKPKTAPKQAPVQS
jgi:hypothetical protein